MPKRLLILEPANTSLLAAQDEQIPRRESEQKIPRQLVAKSLIFLSLFVVLFNSSVPVSAAYIKITQKGEVIVTVLGVENELGLDIPQNTDLKVVNIAGDSASPKANITLAKADFGTNMHIVSSGKTQSLTVEGDKDLIEIEEQGEKQNVLISSSGRSFLLRQKGFVAQTDYEIQVDPDSANVALKAPSGLRYLAILPREALDTLVKAKIITKFDALDTALLSENEGNELVYEIAGMRSLNFFNMYTYDVGVKSKVSATTGEIISINQPFWLPLVTTLLG